MNLDYCNLHRTLLCKDCIIAYHSKCNGHINGDDDDEDTEGNVRSEGDEGDEDTEGNVRSEGDEESEEDPIVKGPKNAKTKEKNNKSENDQDIDDEKESEDEKKR